MAVSKAEVQVQWGSANSTSVGTSGNATSDEFNLDATGIAAMLGIKAKNDGSPTSGDTVDYYVVYTLGDPDGTGSDEFDTTGHAQFLAQLDTNTEDPAQVTLAIPASWKGAKVYVENNSSGTAITVSTTMYETKVS